MKLGLQLGYWGAGPPENLLELVSEAERTGFDAVFAAESWGSDAFTPLAWWGSRTGRVRLGTSVAQISARTPTACAMHALTLDHLSGGRAVLGLGVSGPQVVEGWYGAPFSRPLARTREYVSLVRQVLARQAPVRGDGPHYPLPYRGPGAEGLGKPLRPITHPLRADLPIWLGAEGPRNVALAAEIADGWLAVYYSLGMAPMYNEWLDEGFARPGARRRREDFEIAAGCQIVISEDPGEIAEAYTAMRPVLALYIGGMGAPEKNFHASLFARMGYGEVVADIGRLFRDGRREEAAAAVPDELISEVAFIGSASYVRSRVDEWERSGVSMLQVGCRDAAQVALLARTLGARPSGREGERDLACHVKHVLDLWCLSVSSIGVERSGAVSDLGLWNIAEQQPDRLAVVAPDGREVSYAELAASADRYGRGLQAMGLRPGDAIVVMLPNTVDLLACYFAALQTGLYVVMINWHLVGAEVAYIIDDSEAKAFVAHERFAEVATEAAEQAGLARQARFGIGDVPGFRPLAELGAGEPVARPGVRTMGSPMLYTSGTTGRPKGVRRPLTGADPDQVPLASSWFFGIFGLEPFDDHVHICCSPLYHTAVLNFTGISIQLGHTAVLMERWDAEEMLRLIERYRVTHSHMVPTQFHRLLALPEKVRAGYDVSSLRAMVHGAAPCPQETKRRMLEWWGPVVIEYYAATEGGGTVIDGHDWWRKPGSVGRPWPGSEVRVLDNDGNELPAGEIGTVYMKMGGSSFEYHKDPEKTEKSRVGELFTLGDVGYLDADGYLFLCDRKSDVIISGGVNIYPAEIEGELAVHPKVADVAVFGIPHPDWGEQIKAVVQPAEHVTPDDGLSEELLEFAKTRLAKFKLPRSIDYLAELPRDPNGKLYKRKLRDPYWADQDSAI